MTQEERQEIVQDVVNEIVTQSTSIDELPVATSINDAASLPAYRRGTSELLSMPIGLISQPAVDAAEEAHSAAEDARLAKQEADAAKDAANGAADAANEAAETANDAANTVLEQIDRIEGIQTTANSAKNTADANNEQLGGLTLMPILASTFEEMADEDKDENTLYLGYEEEE